MLIILRLSLAGYVTITCYQTDTKNSLNINVADN